MTPEELEIQKYYQAYKAPEYKMGMDRKIAARNMLMSIPQYDRWSLLDVGAGRGETMEMARELGWEYVKGVEVVDYLLTPDIVKGLAWDLPFQDRSFTVVTCLDVIEHLLPHCAEPTIRELARVARSRVLLTISNLSHEHKSVQLHVNCRPYDDWHRDLQEWMPEFLVVRRPNFSTSISQCWEAIRQ